MPRAWRMRRTRRHSWLAGTDLSTTFAAAVAACGPYQSTTVWTCQFVFPNGKFSLVAWDNNGTCSGSVYGNKFSKIVVPAAFRLGVFSTWRDLGNATHTINGGTVQIGLQPILIND